MQVIVKEVVRGEWSIQAVSQMAASITYTRYPSEKTAVEEARRQYPGVEITVERLRG